MVIDLHEIDGLPRWQLSNRGYEKTGKFLSQASAFELAFHLERNIFGTHTTDIHQSQVDKNVLKAMTGFATQRPPLGTIKFKGGRKFVVQLLIDFKDRALLGDYDLHADPKRTCDC